MTEVPRESIGNLDIDTITLPQIDQSDEENEEEKEEKDINGEITRINKKKIEKWDWNADFIPLDLHFNPQHSINDDDDEEENEEEEVVQEPILKHTTKVLFLLSRK